MPPPGTSSQEGVLRAVRPRLCSVVPDLPARLPSTPTYEAGVVVLVCLHVVLQDLLADVLGALIKVFVHAVGPGDGALLSAVELLQERLTITTGSGATTALLQPPPCSPHRLALSPDGTAASHALPPQLPLSPLPLSQP